MSFLLTDEFDDSFKYEGKIYHIEMSFDKILLLFEMFNDESISESEKPFLAMEMLIQEDLPCFESFEQAFELFKYIMKEFLEVDLEVKAEQQPKIYDFQKDAGLIYASFFAVYKIDLFEFKGKLHWKKFNALLANLDDESKFKQVVGYRTMKVPTGDSVSKEYREHVLKMKQIYALDERSPEEQINDTFDALAQTFKANAKVVDNDG